MIENLNHILIFKTNVNTESDKHYLKEVFDTHALIDDWHIDLEDVDRVLRIVSFKITKDEIIHLINKIGFHCLELE